MITPEQVPTYLEVFGGKYVMTESKRSTGSHQLVVKHSQKFAPNLTVYQVKRDDKSVTMAFCFKQKKNRLYLVVEQDPITEQAIVKLVRPINQPFPDKYLFRFETKNEYGSLRSVAECDQYLSVSKDNVITLSSNPYHKFKINLKLANRMASRNFALPEFRLVCSDHCMMMSHRQENTCGPVVSIHTPVPSSSGHLL